MKVESLNYKSWIFLDRRQNGETIGQGSNINSGDEGTIESGLALGVFLHEIANQEGWMELRS